MEASSESEMVLDQVLQGQNPSGIPLRGEGSKWRLGESGQCYQNISPHISPHTDLTLEIEFYLVLIFTRGHKLGLVGAGGGLGLDRVSRHT